MISLCRSLFKNCIVLYLIALLAGSCSKNPSPSAPVVVPPIDTPLVPAAFDINSITDTYDNIAALASSPQWGPHNVHDPSILKTGDYYYCYSTDVGYGIDVRAGIQVRKSEVLVEWTFVGWVFNSLPAMGVAFITGHGGTPFNSLWAPYIMKAGNEYRLYYSLSSAVSRLSVIGLATATSPTGPWTEKGLAVTSINNATLQTNAIDPTVVVTPAGEYWMYYGSAYDGIYVLQLDPATGLALNNGDKGVRIAQRGFTGSAINGNIEGSEIIYNAAQKKYYLFIAYDWLETKYNVRVGRGDQPQGPFYDFNGVDINTVQDHGPMIVAPYQFQGHGGWQGTAHCSVFKDEAGNYFLAHQGRPALSKYSMDLHVRKIYWMPDGWPVVSPERYAWEDNSAVARDSLIGQWEQISLNYRVVPGFAAEQTSPDLQTSSNITIDGAGTISNATGSSWSYAAPLLELNWSDGTRARLIVQKGRDWENKKATYIFTGLNDAGTAVWGKKK